MSEECRRESRLAFSLQDFLDRCLCVVRPTMWQPGGDRTRWWLSFLDGRKAGRVEQSECLSVYSESPKRKSLYMRVGLLPQQSWMIPDLDSLTSAKWRGNRNWAVLVVYRDQKTQKSEKGFLPELSLTSEYQIWLAHEYEGPFLTLSISVSIMKFLHAV